MRSAPAELILSFAQIGAMLRARQRLIAIVTACSVILAGVASILLPKTYVATAQLYIDYRVNDPIAGRQFNSVQDESYLQTQFDVIKSVQVAERVIRELRLQDSPEAQKLISRYGEQAALRNQAETLLQNIEVSPHKNSRVIDVQFGARTPQMAKQIVNAVVKTYIELSLEMMNAPARARKEQYNAQLESLSHQIDELQTKLTTYQQDHQIADADERADLESKQMATLATHLLDVQMQRIEAQAKRQALEKLVRDGNHYSDLPEIAGIGHISGIKAALISVDDQLANARTSLGLRHPKYLALQAERQELLDKLQKESATALQSQTSVEGRLAQQQKMVESELAGYQKKNFENKKHRDVISSYQRQLDSVQKVYNAAIQKFDELLMTSNVAISGSSVMQWAELPERAAKPLLRSNLAFGLIAGLLFGFGLAFLLELSKRKVRCVEDIEREFDLPVIAQIGFENRTAAGQSAP